MSKGLDALNEIKKGIDTALWDGNEYDYLDIIEKELKALEIIKEKRVDIRLLFETFNYYKNGLKAYNGMRTYGYDLTQEEYDLLKEVLL